MSDITDAQVEAWVVQYVRAWETGEAADIRQLFTDDGRASVFRHWNKEV